MAYRSLIASLLVILCACGSRESSAQTKGKSLSLNEARRGFRTSIKDGHSPQEPIPRPPARTFQLISYESPAGRLAAYLSPDPGDGKKHPAIVWITGGDCNSIGELWEDRPRNNDQTAAAYRKAGIIMMFPSLRGGNENPGRREGFFGEVDDVLAATKYLASQSYVDPNRIYLGGHSTGGTLAMLVAESGGRYRAAFAFGPADDVTGYGDEYLPFDVSNRKEIDLRSPGLWLDSVACPLFVVEGTKSPTNLDSLRSMERQSTNPNIHFLPAKGLNHFSVLAPMNELIAEKIMRDEGPKSNISFSAEDLGSLGK